MIRRLKAAPALLTLLLAAEGAARAATLHFAGYDWTVKSGNGLGPGPCDWSESNAWVDETGALHLKISHTGGTWSCAEVETTQSLGFGRYQWWVIGEVDKLDANVVLGLFNYPTPDVGPDGPHEIDIAVPRWGIPSPGTLNFRG